MVSQKVASVLDLAVKGAVECRDERGGGEKSFLLDPISYTHTHTLEHGGAGRTDRQGRFVVPLLIPSLARWPFPSLRRPSSRARSHWPLALREGNLALLECRCQVDKFYVAGML